MSSLRQGRAIRLSVIFLWLLVVCSGMCHAQSQAPPVPPVDIVQLAQQAAAQFGKSVSLAAPTSSYLDHAKYTGNSIWRLSWHDGTQSFFVSVDAGRQKVVEIFDFGEVMALTNTDSNSAVTITAAQASSTVDALTQWVGLAAGDWYAPDVELRQHTAGKEWWRQQVLYVAGYRSIVERVDGYVNPYTGHLISWRLTDGCIYLSPQAPLLLQAQLEPIADAAFQQYAGANLEPGESIPASSGSGAIVWQAPSPESNVGRLAASFYYNIPDTANRTGFVVEARVDAETGELWDVRSITAGGTSRCKPVPSSLRFALLTSLSAGRQTAAPLTLAVASGKPGKASAPGAGAQRFTQQVKGKTVLFAFDVKSRRLTWQTDDGKWAGLALPEKQTAALAAWLKTAPAETKTATKP